VEVNGTRVYLGRNLIFRRACQAVKTHQDRSYVTRAGTCGFSSVEVVEAPDDAGTSSASDFAMRGRRKVGREDIRLRILFRRKYLCKQTFAAAR
jgi:hypothetical protein